jgi:hypothetical protein
MRDHTAWLKKNQGVVIEPEIWKDLAEGQSTEAIPYGGGHEVVITREIQVKADIRALAANEQGLCR